MARYELTEAAEVQWKEYLKDFMTTVYPELYEQYGLSKGEALIVWEINQLKNEMIDLQRIIENEG